MMVFMDILNIASQKGGAGKTTLAAHLAVEAERSGARPVAMGVVVEMGDQAHKGLCFVVNGATPRSLIALEAVQALAQHGPVAPVILHQRIDFTASMTDGHTVGEINPRSPSAEEVSALWQYVTTRLRRQQRSL